MAEDTTLKDLLSEAKDESGILDAFLNSIEASCTQEFKKNRITGPDYANVYLGSIQSAMSQAVAFALGLRTANAQAELLEAQTLTEIQNTLLMAAQTASEGENLLLIQAQIAKLTAETSLIGQKETTEVQNTLLVTEQIADVTANTALTNAKATTEAAQTTVLTAQELQIDAEKLLIDAKTTTEANVSSREAATVTRIGAETTRIAQEEALLTNQVLTEVTKELKLDAEIALLDMKTFTEEAQRLDTVNAVGVAGVIGKQKDLYQAQIDGFDRDAEQKILKVMFDAWSVARSTDTDGTSLPTEIADAPTLNATLQTAITNAGI